MKADKLKPLLVLVLSCINLVTKANELSQTGKKNIPTTAINDFVVDPWMYIVGALIFFYAAIQLLSSDSAKQVIKTSVEK